MAGSVQGFDVDGAELEGRVVGGRFGFGGAVAAADYGEGVVFYLGWVLDLVLLGPLACGGRDAGERPYGFRVAACVVVMTVL